MFRIGVRTAYSTIRYLQEPHNLRRLRCLNEAPLNVFTYCQVFAGKWSAESILNGLCPCHVTVVPLRLRLRHNLCSFSWKVRCSHSTYIYESTASILIPLFSFPFYFHCLFAFSFLGTVPALLAIVLTIIMSEKRKESERLRQLGIVFLTATLPDQFPTHLLKTFQRIRSFRRSDFSTFLSSDPSAPREQVL